MVAAAYLPHDVVNQGQKLALMKICDSADDETRLSRPGLRRLRAWVGVTDKRVMTIVTELVGKGLIERVEVGKMGRRSVYKVFPLGVPPLPSNDDLDARFEAADAAPKNTRKIRNVPRSAPSKPAMTHEDIDAREDLDPQALAAGEGVRRAGFHGWNPDEEESRVSPVKPTGFHRWNPKGFTGETPSLPSSSSILPNPPTPTADAAGEPRGCPTHRTPAANCRGCKTNPRSAREARDRERAEAERQSQREFMENWHADQARARQVAQDRPQDVEAARLAARQAHRTAREGPGDPRSPTK